MTLRNPWFPLLLALASIASSSVASDSASDSAPDSAPDADLLPTAAGIHERVFSTDQGLLRWAVDVPSEDTDAPRPLVLALHFGFDRSREFPPYYGKGFMERVVAPGLRDLGAFIVAPDSHGLPWSDDAITQPVLALLDALIADPRIDGQRVIVTGYSMGGAGTWWFASQYGDRFAAAVPMAGRFRRDLADTLRDNNLHNLPIHALHSRDDELMPIKPVRKLIEELAANGLDAQLTELKGITHFESPRYAKALRKVIVPWLQQTLAPAEPSE